MLTQRLLILPFLFSVLLLSNLTHAELTKVKLVIPEALNLLYLDGKKQKRSLFDNGDQELEVVLGPHKLVLEYEEIWEDGDDHDRVRSEPFMLSFAADADVNYRIKLPTLTNVNAAKAYAKLPSVTLVNLSSNQKVEADISYQLEQQSFLDSFVKNQSRPEAKAGKADTVVQSVAASQTLDQLKHWWDKATKQERAEFLQWTVQ